MENNNIIISLNSLGDFCSVNKALVTELGNSQAFLISELCSEHDYWVKRNKLVDNKWFYSTVDYLKSQTGFSKAEQLAIIKKLKAEKIVETKLMNTPPKRFFYINVEVLMNKIKSGMEKRKIIDSEEINIALERNISEVYNTPLLSDYPNISFNTKQIITPSKTEENKDDDKHIEKSNAEKEFEELWNRYPRKESKARALKKYLSLAKKDKNIFDKVNQGLNNYIKYITYKKTAKEYIKTGGNWFSEQGWENDYDISFETNELNNSITGIINNNGAVSDEEFKKLNIKERDFGYGENSLFDDID